MIRNIYFLFIKRELGVFGVTGVLLIFLAMFIYLFCVLAIEKNIQNNELSLQDIKKIQLSIKPTIKDSTELRDISKASQMPEMKGLPKELSSLLRLIEQQNLNLIAGEYKLGQSQNDQYIQYEMTLPLKGRYQDIRYFINSMSNELPFVGIKTIDLKRESIIESDIEVRLIIVFYLINLKNSYT